VQRAEGRFRSIGGGRFAELTWRGGLYDPAQFVACQARTADLIILGPESSWPCPCNVANPGDVVMAAGRPVLVTPPNFTLKPMLAHVLVAWKDCRESRRALTDALPLLGKAGKVSVIESQKETRRPIATRSRTPQISFVCTARTQRRWRCRPTVTPPRNSS
jgi:hypothetical protein